MENFERSQYYEDSTDETDEEKRLGKKKTRKWPSFVASWLARSEQKEDQPEEPDNKKGVLRRFFGKFVGLDVVRNENSEAIPSDERESLPAKNLDDYYSESGQFIGSEQYFVGNKSAETSHEDFLDSQEDSVAASHEPGKYPKQESVVNADETHESSLSVDDEEFTPYPAFPVEEMQRRYEDEKNDLEVDTTDTVTELQAEGYETDAPAKREVFRGATEADLRTEKVARKRADRRLKKRTHKQGDELERVHKQNRQQEKQAREAKEQTDALRQQVARYESMAEQMQTEYKGKPIENKISERPHPSTTPEYKQYHPSAFEKSPPKSQTVDTPERRVPQYQEAEKASKTETVARRFAEKVREYENKHENPEKVLKEMLAAAEVDAPVERVYERSHEVRDEATNKSQPGAVSVGSILQQTPGSLSVKQDTVNSSKLNNKTQDEQQSELYKQAAQQGFMGAIFILVLLLIAYVLV